MPATLREPRDGVLAVDLIGTKPGTLPGREVAVLEGYRQTAFERAEELSVAPVAERRAAAADERERIGRILDSMTDALRIPLIMRDMDQFSYQEIADELGIGLSAVKMRIKRAREQFRQMYREEASVADHAVEP